jgi:hypothetical protein
MPSMLAPDQKPCRCRVAPRGRALAAALGGMLLSISIARAQQPVEAPSPQFGSRDLVWLAGTASLLSASLGVLFALRVRSLYDRAEMLPGVSPERLVLKTQMQHAEHSADALFGGGLVLAAVSVILILTSHDGEPAAPAALARLHLTPTLEAHGGGLTWRGNIP